MARRAERERLNPAADVPEEPAQSTTARQIAILGGGFAGTMVATHLLRGGSAPLEINLIERRPVLGEGLAYSTTLGTHVLNVPAEKMGAFPEAIGDFQTWLKALEPEFGEFAPHGFVPRIWYGSYLRSIIAEAERTAPAGVRLNRIVDSVESVDIVANDPRLGLTIGLASGDEIRADQLVLAFGNLPAGDPPLETGMLREHPGYLSDPWDTEAVRAIPADADVLLIGTGLTMVDWAFSLGRQGHRGTIHALSRRGLLPRSHGPAAGLVAGSWLDDAPATALGLSRAVRQEVARTVEAGGDWRSVLDALRPRTAGLWAALPIAERRRFVRHLRPYWDVHRHRAAPHVASLIEEMREAGRLVVHAGRLVAVADRPARAGGAPASAAVTIRARRSGTEEVLVVERIVNAIGPGGDIRSSGEAFLEGLLGAGIGQADPLGLGLRSTADGALIAADGSVSDRIFTLGSPRRGDLWESTAVPELRVQAARLAEHLVLDSALFRAEAPR